MSNRRLNKRRLSIVLVLVIGIFLLSILFRYKLEDILGGIPDIYIGWVAWGFLALAAVVLVIITGIAIISVLIYGLVSLVKWVHPIDENRKKGQ